MLEDKIDVTAFMVWLTETYREKQELAEFRKIDFNRFK